MDKIKCSLCLKKKQAKMLIFAPKIALRVERSDPARNHKFRATFWMPVCNVVSFSATVEILTIIWEKPGGALTRNSTDDRSELWRDSKPVKIEYNCRYFILSFRRQIGEHKFGKNGFHTLQSTMSHRPPPIDQFLKFKNHCSLIFIPCWRSLMGEIIEEGSGKFGQ